MKKRIFYLFLGFILLFPVSLRADEGMWLPNLLQQIILSKMQGMGLKLTQEQIYDVNKSSLKDAIVALDHGSCTGELVSADGLIFTNHHCGYREIQSHSTVEHDYLSNGFWAKTREEELSNPGKTVSFLVRIEDVTEKIFAVKERFRDNFSQQLALQVALKNLTEEATKDTHYEASVETMFNGNQFFLFVYETFKDVRLVGAPPSSIGKFGGDTDNWMWPRQTGDFSIFRVYCGKDGKPAEYSKENVPYHPKHSLPISLKGVKKGDFAMILGYPGTTNRYLPSWGVKETMDNENTVRVKLRTMKQNIMKKDMDSDPKIRIQYAAKYSESSNYWKYSIGQNQGLKNLKVVKKKEALEKQLGKWIKADTSRKRIYADVLSNLKKSYKEKKDFDKYQQYWFEAFYLGSEVVKQAFALRQLAAQMQQSNDEQKNREFCQGLKEEGEKFFKDFNAPTDKKILIAMFEVFQKDVDKKFHPKIYETIKNSYAGSFEKYAQSLYSSSILVDKEKYFAFLDNPSLEVLSKDLGYQLMESVLESYFAIQEKLEPFNNEVEKMRQLYVKGILEMQKDLAHYPDANSTMRLTYGKVDGYVADGKTFDYQTDLKSLVVKHKDKDEEFDVPAKLRELYEKKDFGKYGENGTLPVCFIANTDITGGNSGSPVINGNGELIGVAFDGNWEAMSGDIAFEPEIQRTIILDIRYLLFVIDKFAGAGHLLKELKFVE